MLTDSALRSLKPKEKLYSIADRDGMYVTIQPSGTIVFRFDYRLNGRRETLTLGRRNVDRTSIGVRQADDHPKINEQGRLSGLRMVSHQIVHRPIAVDSLQLPSQFARLRW